MRARGVMVSTAPARDRHRLPAHGEERGADLVGVLDAHRTVGRLEGGPDLVGAEEGMVAVEAVDQELVEPPWRQRRELLHPLPLSLVTPA